MHKKIEKVLAVLLIAGALSCSIKAEETSVLKILTSTKNTIKNAPGYSALSFLLVASSAYVCQKKIKSFLVSSATKISEYILSNVTVVSDDNIIPKL